LDEVEGFSSRVKDRASSITNLDKFIEEIEIRYKVVIEIDSDNIELRTRDKE
jgi:hypothetical protein